jgi:hypothetical protein
MRYSTTQQSFTQKPTHSLLGSHTQPRKWKPEIPRKLVDHETLIRKADPRNTAFTKKITNNKKKKIPQHPKPTRPNTTLLLESNMKKLRSNTLHKTKTQHKALLAPPSLKASLSLSLSLGGSKHKTVKLFIYTPVSATKLQASNTKQKEVTRGWMCTRMCARKRTHQKPKKRTYTQTPTHRPTLGWLWSEWVGLGWVGFQKREATNTFIDTRRQKFYLLQQRRRRRQQNKLFNHFA